MPYPTRAEIHTLLLGLAGRAPDAWLAITRSSLAAGDLRHVAQTVAALASSGFAFTTPEAATVAALLGGGPVPSAGGSLGPTHRFERGAGEPMTELPPGVTALWRAVRSDGMVVHLAEAADGAEPAALCGALQRLVGDPVEVFTADEPLPPYHESALNAAALVAAAPAPVRVARVFDGVDPGQGPFFAPDRQRVDDSRRERLLDYLRGGELVLDVAGELDDVLEPGVEVAAGFRSDGDWVWSEATVHYVDRHRLAPDPDLAQHIGDRRTAPARLRRSSRARVRAALAAGPGAAAATLWRAG